MADNPAGCVQTGCDDGEQCIDFGNSGYAEFCLSSYCACSGFYGSWGCTEDCNGGTCFEFGDVNFDNNLDIVDVVLIVNMILNIMPGSLSDVNSDGITNVIDVILLVNLILN